MRKMKNKFAKKIAALIIVSMFILMLVPSTAFVLGARAGPGGVESSNAPALAESLISISSIGLSTSQNILVITFDAGFLPQSMNVFNTLNSLGYSVTHLYNPAPGVINATISSGTFQQVWLFDIETSLQLTNATDIGALVNWYNNNAKGNIIIDARSYGAYYDIATDGPFIANQAHAFMLRGGGLWIGTDHYPTWAYNGNALLTALGYATVTGIQNPVGVAGDTTSELFNMPNVVDPTTLYAYSSTGIAPTGIQPDGIVLTRHLWENETSAVLASHSLMPYIGKTLMPTEGDLGDMVNVTITVYVPPLMTATIVDTLPEELTYIKGTGVPIPKVGKTPPPPPRHQTLSYTIEESGTHTIEFDVKVTKAYWEDREVCNVVAGTWTDQAGEVHEREAIACFTIHAFEELHKNVGIPKADVVFSFDLTGSMVGVINETKTEAEEIIDAVQASVGDVAFGVVTHRDYEGWYNHSGYVAPYGSPGDWPYQLEQAINTNADLSIAAIQAMSAGGGADGPESYARVLYEALSLSWRPSATRFLVLFGDNIPHDEDFWTSSTGQDPGPDAVGDTADDIDIQEVVAAVANENITILSVDCSFGGWAAMFYEYMANETGGQYFELGETGISDAIKEIVKAEAQETLTIKVGMETQWAVVIDIVNPFSYIMTDTVITDRFGAEIELDGIISYDGNDLVISPEKPKGKGKVGSSEKLFLTWDIGDLEPGEMARAIFLVSTDLNPAGHQEYTSPGVYEFNSGATLKFIDPEQDMQLSAVTDSIYVTVLPEEDP
jgi:hypothetical protein